MCRLVFCKGESEPLCYEMLGARCLLESCFHPANSLFIFKSITALQSGSSMEVVTVACQGSGTQDSVAVRSENKSYSYKQLISSAWSISGLLCSGDSNVSLQIYVYIFLNTCQLFFCIL